MSTEKNDLLKIRGFLKRSKRNASGGIYRGRLSCPEVQWTGTPPDAFATFTVTAEEIADAAESRLLWTDQDVQRGVKPGLEEAPARELCLCDGYPDPEKYIFDTDKADTIVEKLLTGEKSYLNPLVWNLRPGHFEAYWNEETRELFMYQGKIYLPDSHHRQQAILKAIRTWREATRDFPRFSGAREFKVELYFLTREDEGNYFYEKNQLPKPTSKSKAYDLTTLDDLSLLAKSTIERSEALKNNVNRVTDRLTAKNPQVLTLSTLREMMKALATAGEVDASELEGTAIVAARFYDLLASVRPELGQLGPVERRSVRSQLLVDAAVMMHGYAALMRDFQTDISKSGLSQAVQKWETKLRALSKSTRYSLDRWSGDLFEKNNPLWLGLGIVKPGRDGKKLTVLNTGAARIECGRVLRTLVTAQRPTNDLSLLMVR